jgi:hypothetical protein
MNLIAQFCQNKKIEGAHLMHQKKFDNHPKRIECLPEADVLPQGEGNLNPRNELGQEWDV